MTRLEKLTFTAVLASLASPALATPTYQAPAPAVGVGIGAVLLVGAGYRAVKRRIGR